MSRVPPDPELEAIEKALAGLAPAPGRLDRDNLMFQAGVLASRAARRIRWAWPSAAALLALVVVCQSCLLAARPTTSVVERIVVVHDGGNPPHAPATAVAAPSPMMAEHDTEPPSQAISLRGGSSPSSRLLDTDTPSSRHTVLDCRRLQDLALHLGLDAWPEPVPRPQSSSVDVHRPDPGSASAGVLRRLELERILNPGDRS